MIRAAVIGKTDKTAVLPMFLIKKITKSIYFLFQIVLAACSNFFANIFSANNGEKSQQSLIVLEDIRALDFKHLLQFMYHGQVDIDRFGNMGCQVSKITM